MSTAKTAKTTRKAKTKAPAKPVGRPTRFTQSVADEICARLAKGEPLAEICRDERMPAVRTVSDWKRARDGFSADFARARDEGFDHLAAECLVIADTPLIGEERIKKADGGLEIKEGDMLGHRKLQIETRLKLLAKWDPKRYGDKVDINHGGQDGNPIKTESNVTVSAEEAYKRLIDGGT